MVSNVFYVHRWRNDPISQLSYRINWIGSTTTLKCAVLLSKKSSLKQPWICLFGDFFTDSKTMGFIAILQHHHLGENVFGTFSRHLFIRNSNASNPHPKLQSLSCTCRQGFRGPFNHFPSEELVHPITQSMWRISRICSGGMLPFMPFAGMFYAYLR